MSNRPSFRIITVRSLVMGIVDRWSAIYAGAIRNSNTRAFKVLRDLQSLDLSTVGASTIKELVGNPEWVTLRCTVCNASVRRAVITELSQEHDLIVCGLCVGGMTEALAQTGVGDPYRSPYDPTDFSNIYIPCDQHR